MIIGHCWFIGTLVDFAEHMGGTQAWAEVKFGYSYAGVSVWLFAGKYNSTW